MPKAIDLTGKRFGKLTAISKADSRNKHTYWLCECDCGKRKEIQTTNLTSGATTSCGQCNKKSGFIKQETQKICPICNKTFTTKAINRKYCYECSPSENIINRAAIRDRQRAIKHRLVEYKGGKCEKCGYDKCEGALDFHHRNPEEKDFSLAQIHLSDKITMEMLFREVDKCDLLCANCHREEHYIDAPIV